MYVGRFNILLIYLLTLSTVLGFIFHFDTGVYLNATILLILTHSILSKKLKEAFFIILFLIINWFIIFKFFGLIEMTSMFDQFLHLASNADKMHGLEYPQPFFTTLQLVQLRICQVQMHRGRGILLQPTMGKRLKC